MISMCLYTEETFFLLFWFSVLSLPRISTTMRCYRAWQAQKGEGEGKIEKSAKVS